MQARALSGGLIAKVILVAAVVVGGLYALYLTREIVGLLLIAVFFAVAMAPPVNWLDEHRLPRSIAILLVYLGIGGAVFGIGLLLVPPLVDGVDRLSKDLPGYVTDLRDNATFAKYDDKYDITPKLREQARDLPDRLGDAAGTLASVTVEVFTRVIQLVTILVVTFFLLMDGRRMLEWFYGQLPGEREARARAIAAGISRAVSGYVTGNLLISVIAGTVTYVTLSILDVPFAVPLAVLFAFFDLIPLVGSALGGIIVGIVAAFVDFPTALVVWVIVLIVYQQIENNFIQPAVYNRTVELHPLSVIVAVLVGAALLGILGALIAIPAAATVQIFLRDWWTHRTGAAQAPATAEPA